MKYLKKIFDRKTNSETQRLIDLTKAINDGFSIQDLKDDFPCAQFGLSGGEYDFYLKIGYIDGDSKIEYSLLVPYIEEFIDRVEEMNLYPTGYRIFKKALDYSGYDQSETLPDEKKI